MAGGICYPIQEFGDGTGPLCDDDPDKAEQSLPRTGRFGGACHPSVIRRGLRPRIGARSLPIGSATGRRTAAASDDTQERILAHWQPQPFFEAYRWSSTKRQTEVTDNGVEPRRASW